MFNRKYGYIKDVPHRAKLYSIHYNITRDISTSSDLRPKAPPIYDQGQLGSCTANGIASLIQYIQPNFTPSRLFIY